MGIKEAIKFDYINFLKSFKELITREFYNPPGIRDVNKRIDEIIALLKRGEKYEAIVKKVKGKYGHTIVRWTGNCKTLREEIRELEQKFFPKEAKNDYK